MTAARNITPALEPEIELRSTPPKLLKLRFAKDVLLFGWANLVCLFLNAILTFLLPRYMSVEDFGYYRLFVLYTNLAGLIHLGLLDGVLLRWAEKPDERIGPETSNVFAFLLAQHLILVPVGIAFLLRSHTPAQFWVVSGFVVYVVVFNCSTLGQFALQARKQFGQLSIYTVVNAGVLLGLVIIWRTFGELNVLTTIASYVAACLVAGIGIWRVALRSNRVRAPRMSHAKSLGADNIRLGWKILIANSFLTLTPSVDRFFVSGAFSIRDFALYAFAGNALAVVYTVALSAARVVFPYLSEGTNMESRRRAYDLGRAALLTLWSMSLALYFPTAALVHWILPAYAASLPIVRLLMINSGLVVMIHVLHANYFRVHLALNRFLMGSAAGVISATVLLLLARHTASLPWVAGAMTAAVAIWWTANEVLLARDVDGDWNRTGRALVLWLLISAAFLATSMVNKLPWAALGYVLVSTAVLTVGLRETLRTLLTTTLALFSRSNPCLETA